VLLGKRVTHVEHLEKHILAHCQDGSAHQGDLIVGADGVRSIVRQRMWDYMISQGLFREVEIDRTGQNPVGCVGYKDQLLLSQLSFFPSPNYNY
jgi:2-polyprenyl-6-methoxyphenol hydroxylase-like FAD-dependent oxidoreductase